MPPTVAIALGSNLGDRAWHLRRAVHLLADVFRVVRVSSLYENPAIDAPPGSPPFLNMAVTGYTSLPPLALLDALLSIESRLGRGIRNAPRPIDLDLIAYDAVRMHTPRLTLPHPRAHERDFVLLPLREIGYHPSPTP
jgi:2-amino-4-hydroxy-6-hydroxymethyldihydropteridine diphosphokinase